MRLAVLGRDLPVTQQDRMAPAAKPTAKPKTLARSGQWLLWRKTQVEWLQWEQLPHRQEVADDRRIAVTDFSNSVMQIDAAVTGNASLRRQPAATRLPCHEAISPSMICASAPERAAARGMRL